MHNVAFSIQYDGTHYHGFQTQQNARAVQDVLEEAIRRLTGETVRLIGSGRTDTGVHARGQVVNFSTTSPIPIGNWCMALNAWLPEDIIIRQACHVPHHFHSRFDATSKTYRYEIDTGKWPDVMMRHARLHWPRKLDRDAMHRALPYFIGEHDFSTFSSPRGVQKNKIRKLTEAYMIEDHHILRIMISGNGFLFQMIRIMTGTLLKVGLGQMKAEDIPYCLAQKNRAYAGPTAEPHGLTLDKVEYVGFGLTSDQMG